MKIQILLSHIFYLPTPSWSCFGYKIPCKKIQGRGKFLPGGIQISARVTRITVFIASALEDIISRPCTATNWNSNLPDGTWVDCRVSKRKLFYNIHNDTQKTLA